MYFLLCMYILHIFYRCGVNTRPSCACTHFSKYPIKAKCLNVILTLQMNFLNCCQQSIHFVASLFILFYMHMKWWEMKQWIFVGRVWCDNLMNGSLIPEMQFVIVTCSLWLTHWGDTMRRDLQTNGRAENSDKAALLSLQQGVFELSPGDGRRGVYFGRQSSE